jgi:hypothetical protein
MLWVAHHVQQGKLVHCVSAKLSARVLYGAAARMPVVQSQAVSSLCMQRISSQLCFGNQSHVTAGVVQW